MKYTFLKVLLTILSTVIFHFNTFSQNNQLVQINVDQGDCSGSIVFDIEGLPNEGAIPGNSAAPFNIIVQLDGVIIEDVTISEGNSGVFYIIDGLCEGEYSIIVINKFGCSASYEADLNDPCKNFNPPMARVANPTACDESDGSILWRHWQDTDFDYVYWDHGSNELEQNNLSEGTYILNIFHDGCMEQQVYHLVSPEMEYDITIEPSCKFLSTGEITIVVLGTEEVSGFEWANGVEHNDNGILSNAINLSSGTYCVTISLGNGCELERCIEVEDLPYEGQIYLNTSSDELICPDQPDGTISLDYDGGTKPYSFKSSLNTHPWYGSNAYPSSGGLLPGNYSFTVTDQCGRSASSTVHVESYQPILLELIDNQDICSGDTEVEIIASGGEGILEFKLQNQGPWMPLESPKVIDLSAGEYTITVRDQAGCEVSDFIEVVIFPEIDLFMDEHINFCADENNEVLNQGTIIVCVENGNPPYNFDFIYNENPSYPVHFHDYGICADLTIWDVFGTQGSWTANVTDVNGCVDKLDFYLDNNYSIVRNPSNCSLLELCGGEVQSVIPGQPYEVIVGFEEDGCERIVWTCDYPEPDGEQNVIHSIEFGDEPCKDNVGFFGACENAITYADGVTPFPYVGPQVILEGEEETTYVFGSHYDPVFQYTCYYCFKAVYCEVPLWNSTETLLQIKSVDFETDEDVLIIKDPEGCDEGDFNVSFSCDNPDVAGFQGLELGCLSQAEIDDIEICTQFDFTEQEIADLVSTGIGVDPPTIDVDPCLIMNNCPEGTECIDGLCYHEVCDFYIKVNQVSNQTQTFTYNLQHNLAPSTPVLFTFNTYNAKDEIRWTGGISNPGVYSCNGSAGPVEEVLYVTGGDIIVEVIAFCETGPYSNTRFLLEMECLNPERVANPSFGNPIKLDSMNDTEGDFNVYPNPFENSFTLSMHNPSKSKAATALIYSTLGQSIMSKDLTLEKGENEFLIETPNDMSPGLYFIKVIDENDVILGEQRIVNGK